MNLVRLITASILSLGLGAFMAPGAALASVDAPSPVGKGSSMVAPQDGIEIAFCFVSTAWAVPNTTIYAPDRDAAKRRASGSLVYCKDGPCSNDGEMEPLKESCTF